MTNSIIPVLHGFCANIMFANPAPWGPILNLHLLQIQAVSIGLYLLFFRCVWLELKYNTKVSTQLTEYKKIRSMNALTPGLTTDTVPKKVPFRVSTFQW